MTQTSTESAAHAEMVKDHVLLSVAADWLAAGHDLALAIVIKTWGSSPRQVGSVMLIRGDMQIAGSVSGGCIEGAVIEAGLEAIQSGTGQRLDFGVADETAWEVGLSCGGQVSVLVMPVADAGLSAATVEELATRAAKRQPVRFQIDMQTKQPVFDSEGGRDQDRSRLDEDSDQFYFVQLPSPRLILIGAVHIAQHLAIMASQTGFQVIVVDPRAVFASQQRFSADIDLQVSWPSEYLAKSPTDRSTAVVTLTHDPKIDDDALGAVLDAPIFYLACLGSQRTQTKRLLRLRETGASEEQLARIVGPAGLAIGAKTPAEIAVSILAQLIKAWRSSRDMAVPATHKQHEDV